MDTPIGYIPRPRPRHRKRKAIPIAPPAPTGPLELVSAEVLAFYPDELQVLLVFNTTVDDPIDNLAETSDPARWSANYGDTGFVGTSFEAGDYDRVTLYFESIGPMPGSPSISYGGPSDVGDADGRMLGTFEGRAFD